MPKTIDIPVERESSVKKIISGTVIIIGTLVAGLTGNYNFNPNISVFDEMITGKEYDELRPNLVSIISSRGASLPTHKEVGMWASMIDKEMNDCGDKISFSNVTSNNIVDKANTFLNELDCNKNY